MMKCLRNDFHDEMLTSVMTSERSTLTCCL